MREEFGVYLITNKINNTFYVGSSVRVEKRVNQHKALGSKDISELTLKQLEMILHHSGLYIDMRRLGIENFEFEIIKLGFDSTEQMHDFEYNLINEKDSVFNGYNSAFRINGVESWIHKFIFYNKERKQYYKDYMDVPIEERIFELTSKGWLNSLFFICMNIINRQIIIRKLLKSIVEVYITIYGGNI